MEEALDHKGCRAMIKDIITNRVFNQDDCYALLILHMTVNLESSRSPFTFHCSCNGGGDISYLTLHDTLLTVQLLSLTIPLTANRNISLPLFASQ